MVTSDSAIEGTQAEVAVGVLSRAISEWYENLRDKRGFIQPNIMCAGLYMTEFLALHFPLKRAHYATASQVRYAGGSRVRKLLAEHGELREFTKEGGRTSRATLDHARTLADIFNSQGSAAGLVGLSEIERVAVAAHLQAWFVNRVQEDYFRRKRIEVEIDLQSPIRVTVAALITAGKDRGGNTAGAIAQHLVGAKLKIRFPKEVINVESYTTADAQTGRAGDYQIGDTAIHVTMAPGDTLFSVRCRDNIQQGYRPRVLVPGDRVMAASQLAENSKVGRYVAIQSIEDFVGTNIEEVGGFSGDGVRDSLRELLFEYNKRIDFAESDKSLKIQIPENL